ncbi:MAG: IclR family transcriptional regulator [Anaerolineae bacterium]|nr:IclR family transcriptional regulator [Anaerolineae bacterium]
MTSKRSPEVQSVRRAISILKCFSEEEPELGVGAIGRRLNLPKSTVFRMLNTLEAEGLISQNEENDRYRLGVALIGLASNVLAYSELRRVARPHLRKLSNELQETVSLSILDGKDAVNFDQVVSPGRLVMRVGWVGRRMPVHTVSSGKALIAYSPESEWDGFLTTPLEPLTEKTITSKRELKDELLEVREKGYAIALEELELGLHAISAPIWDHRREVIASVSVSGPSYRLSEERIEAAAASVVKTGMDISQELGYILKEPVK